ncbi:hypothetical protein T4C_13352 [Trichinella pseudospiralis]|uniref:Uncharacterized protein n=1 Tax=Trichinella pseudospiralis TaxID=6337 RepID=A0A0V1HUU1_TRIPS|nr:hypothetical protein T4C_13352 [Trichinella pseudospiralis]
MNSDLSIALGNLLIFGASLLRKRYKYWLKKSQAVRTASLTSRHPLSEIWKDL